MSAAHHIQNPALKRKLESELDRAKAAAAFDAGVAALEEGEKARKTLPAIQAELSTLRRMLERPTRVEATLKQPAKPKIAQRNPKGAEVIVGALTAELRRRGGKTPIRKTLEEIWPADDQEFVRRAAGHVIKANTDPHGTTASGVGHELTSTSSRGFYKELQPTSVFAKVLEMAGAFDFEGHNAVTIPQRASQGGLKPAWVAEHATIPVQQDVYGSSVVQRYKMAIVSTFSEEIARSSVPHIMEIVRTSILDDAATGLDEYFLDTEIGVAGLRPAGSLYLAPTQVSAGGSASDIIADLTWLRQQLVSMRARQPLLVVSTMNVVALEMHFDAQNGIFPFQKMIQAGNLFGLPFVSSDNVRDDHVIAMDASKMAMAIDRPMFDTSSHVTLVMLNADGTDPTMTGVTEAGSVQVSDAATVTGGPAEVRSMFQSAGIAMRMVLPVTFSQIAAGVAYVSGVNW
ncbi:hypothetical protein [Shimia sp. MIT1388]|uniref:hypothetical protein n=1 Tax=Shimia sp. MIT1388 TaxID=3096992 RepID=UPI00399AC676